MPIFCRGRAVAIVGARNASANGVRFARQLAAELGGAGLVVVSGLARGIDAAAHQGSLATGTVAVWPAASTSSTRPRTTASTRGSSSAASSSARCRPGSSRQARHFPRRNRIISGPVASASSWSRPRPSPGSLITARLAGEQGREVFAVPGSPLDPRARGTNDLIRQGATLTEGAEDVLAALAAPVRDAPAAAADGRSRPGRSARVDEAGLLAARLRNREARPNPGPG